MKPRVLVLNCFIKGWNIIKALARDGFEANGGDYRRNAPGLYSRYISDRSRNIIYPNPKEDAQKFAAAIIEHVKNEKYDILLPVNAAEMLALARHKTEIEKYTLFPFENYYKLLLLHDKKYFFEIMSGVLDPEYLPRTWSVGNQTPPITDIIEKAGFENSPPFQIMEDFTTIDHFLNANPGLIYPLMVKTRRATSAVGIYRVQNNEALRSACKKLGEADIIMQENLIGRGVGISSIRWDSPHFIYHFGHKRVREYPISGGASTSREPWDVDEHPLAASLSQLLDNLCWHGVVMFELKEFYSPEGKYEYKFLEANPRFWGSVPLAIVNGINFPALLCRAALKTDLPEVKNIKKIRARILFSDTLSLILNLLKGRRIGYNIRDYLNFKHLYLDDIDLHDLSGTRRVFSRMLSELFSQLTKKS